MPLYFFHVYDGSTAFDDEGVEIASLREVELYMLAVAKKLFQKPEYKEGTWQIEVLDEVGKIIAAMKYGIGTKQ